MNLLHTLHATCHMQFNVSCQPRTACLSCKYNATAIIIILCISRFSAAMGHDAKVTPDGANTVDYNILSVEILLNISSTWPNHNRLPIHIIMVKYFNGWMVCASVITYYYL